MTSASDPTADTRPSRMPRASTIRDFASRVMIEPPRTMRSCSGTSMLSISRSWISKNLDQQIVGVNDAIRAAGYGCRSQRVTFSRVALARNSRWANPRARRHQIAWRPRAPQGGSRQSRSQAGSPARQSKPRPRRPRNVAVAPVDRAFGDETERRSGEDPKNSETRLYHTISFIVTMAISAAIIQPGTSLGSMATKSEPKKKTATFGLEHSLDEAAAKSRIMRYCDNCGSGIDSRSGSPASAQPSVPSGYQMTLAYPMPRICLAAFHDIQQSRRQ